MRILVTGGTGFVGSHSVAALIDRGHEVKLLVRSAERIAPALEPHRVGELPFVEGDVTNADDVEAAMQECDAVLHAASVYSLDVRRADLVRRVNVSGTELVLGTAQRLGLDPVVYVSTVLALLPPDGDEVLTPDSSIKHPKGAYLGSKADAERIARRFQADGAPVVITYPSAVFGPDDPHFGESAQSARDILSGKVRLAPKGGLSIVDVRDVVAAFAEMFESNRGPRRYFLSGTNLGYDDVIDLFAELTERNIRYITLPPWALRPFVQLAGVIQRVLPFRLPVNTEGFQVIAWNPRGDDSTSEAELGFLPRPLTETFSDVIHWMVSTGHISNKQAGKLASR